MKNKLQKWMEKKEQLTRDFEQLRVKAIKRKIYPYWDKFATPEYHRLLRKTNAAADAMLEGYFKYDLSLKGPEHFTRENVFVWGGPTPSWGGSMDKDASLKAQAFFDLDNVMYVYGPLNREMMDLHKNCKKLDTASPGNDRKLCRRICGYVSKQCKIQKSKGQGCCF